ncbi:hypothetical protein [Chroococcus sp. FPU101]|uniref:hypothetical protein n=1 Tax=Chroococcus sp. FPU101 TaxID=1974212 RepID=UPI001A8E6727|nr:hypothetical protein [Chroococcus sp. FPU101]GFE68620.1 hypothetical protein CFPU101_12300 [Chroococcus sp. FPU101]
MKNYDSTVFDILRAYFIYRDSKHNIFNREGGREQILHNDTHIKQYEQQERKIIRLTNQCSIISSFIFLISLSLLKIYVYFIFLSILMLVSFDAILFISLYMQITTNRKTPKYIWECKSLWKLQEKLGYSTIKSQRNNDYLEEVNTRLSLEKDIQSQEDIIINALRMLIPADERNYLRRKIAQELQIRIQKNQRFLPFYLRLKVFCIFTPITILFLLNFFENIPTKVYQKCIYLLDRS